MNNQNFNIELGSRPSNSRRRIVVNPSSNIPFPNYILQINENDDESSQPPTVLDYTGMRFPTQQQVRPKSSICSTICRDKKINIPVLLVLCLLIIDLVLLGYGLFSFVFLPKGPGKELRTSLKPLQIMAANLKTDPLMDIQIMEKGSACPSGFQPLKLGTWPGTLEGCLCESGTLHASPCDQLNTPTCQKGISKTWPIDMYEWGNSDWCVKRAILGTDYVTNIACPPNYKECYPGGCFVNDCPITKVDQNLPNLTLARTQGEVPLIDLQITLGDIPCFNQELSEKFIKGSSYELSAFKESACDKFGQNRQFATRIASQTAYDSFTQNSFPKPVMELPYFAEYAQNTTLALSSMARMKTAKNNYCLDINEQAVDEFFEALRGTATPAFSLVIFFIEAILICVIISLLFQNVGPELFELRDMPKLITNIFCFNSITFVSFVGMFIYFRYFYQFVQAPMEYFESYEALGCFDGGQGSMVVSEFVDIFKRIGASFWYYWALLVTKTLETILATGLYIHFKRAPRFASMQDIY